MALDNSLDLAFSSAPPKQGAEAASRSPAKSDNELPGTVFHDHWWLNAVTGGRFEEATVESGGRIIGRFPYVVARKMGFTECRMPPFTHVLGPVVDPGSGKPQTQLLRRLSTIRDLIDKLPRCDYFGQAFDLSIVDGLAFQERGFRLTPQYTFEIDCCEEMKTIWDALPSKTRQNIRRGQEKFSVVSIEDPNEFVRFYSNNLEKDGTASYINWTAFPELYAQSRARDRGEIISAKSPDGRHAAMVYLVWGHGKMYYLLTTRAKDAGDNGSVNLLIWAAIQRAHDRGLLFDLDAVTTSGTSRFLTRFNGTPKLRIIARKTNLAYSAAQFAKRKLLGYRQETVAFIE